MRYLSVDHLFFFMFFNCYVLLLLLCDILFLFFIGLAFYCLDSQVMIWPKMIESWSYWLLQSSLWIKLLGKLRKGERRVVDIVIFYWKLNEHWHETWVRANTPTTKLLSLQYIQKRLRTTCMNISFKIINGNLFLLST